MKKRKLKTKTLWNRIVVKVLFLVLMSCLILSLMSKTVISVSVDDKVLWFATTKEDDVFSIKQSHSVSKTIVTDHFKINSGKIYHTSIIFEDQGGGGLPDVLDKEEMITINDEGRFVISENKEVELPIRSLNNIDYVWQLNYKDISFDTKEKYLETTVKRTSFLKLIYMKIRW